MRIDGFFTSAKRPSSGKGIYTATLKWVLGALVLAIPATLLAAPKGPPESVPVEVVNTPDVNVANGPLDVVVLNGPPSREPFQAHDFTIQGKDVNSAEVRFGPVPAGKMLEIKHVSSFALLENGSWMYCTLQVLEPGDVEAVVGQHFVLVTPQSGTFKDQYVASTPITLFADAGQTVQFACTYSSQDDSTLLQVGLSGFLAEN